MVSASRASRRRFTNGAPRLFEIREAAEEYGSRLDPP